MGHGSPPPPKRIQWRKTRRFWCWFPFGRPQKHGFWSRVSLWTPVKHEKPLKKKGSHTQVAHWHICFLLYASNRNRRGWVTLVIVPHLPISSTGYNFRGSSLRILGCHEAFAYFSGLEQLSGDVVWNQEINQRLERLQHCAWPKESLSLPLSLSLSGCGLEPMVPFRGRCTTHFSLFQWDWDVHWGYDMDLTHGPCGSTNSQRVEGTR